MNLAWVLNILKKFEGYSFQLLKR